MPKSIDNDSVSHPLLTFLLSLFLPGTGQILNSHCWRAGLFFMLWSICWIGHFSPWWYICAVCAAVEAAWSSYRTR